MFNKRLREIRMKCGFTQQNMADRLNISLNAAYEMWLHTTEYG